VAFHLDGIGLGKGEEGPWVLPLSLVGSGMEGLRGAG
jgi:hypothetical protein